MVRLTFLVLLYWVTSCPNSPLANDILEIVYEWRQLEYDYPSEEERENAIKNGTFKEGELQPVDVDVYIPRSPPNKKMVFITCPRIYDGIPAAIGTVSDKKRNGNPIITPYPNWDWHTNPEMCKKNRIVTVDRVFVDVCDRLWIVDYGKIGPAQVCPPQILTFNLQTNAVDRQYEIPSDQLLNTTGYATVVADITSCEETFAYVADVTGYSLLVYDYKNNKSWAIVDKTFIPIKDQTNFDIAGIEFFDEDGILGLSLSPPGDGSERKLFYHAVFSVTEHWVYTKDLKNESLVSGFYKAPQVFHTFPKSRSDQSSAEAMDGEGNLIFGLLHNISIAAWNINKPFDKSNFKIIGNNKETMQFPSGMKVIKDEKGEESYWVICSRFQIVLSGQKLNASQINFRVLSAKMAKLLADDGDN